jgi:hypothetical protein
LFHQDDGVSRDRDLTLRGDEPDVRRTMRPSKGPADLSHLSGRVFERQSNGSPGISSDVIVRTNRPVDSRRRDLQLVRRGEDVEVIKEFIECPAQALAIRQRNASRTGAIDVDPELRVSALTVENELDDFQTEARRRVARDTLGFCQILSSFVLHDPK